MKNIPRHLLALFTALCLSPFAHAGTLHVDAAKGDDAKDGKTPETAWKTITQACAAVTPGDTVIVHPGIYYGGVRLKIAGTAEHPIVFKTDEIERARVVLSGAWPPLRRPGGDWKLEDAALGLYSASVGQLPARVLYDDADLYPYGALDALKTFNIGEATSLLPGPLHGFAYDAAEKKLYVRLHASGRYGSPDPAQHAMKVAPATGTGGAGRNIAEPAHYNFGVLTDGPAHVVLDGFTFETPGVAGVFTTGGGVTVRNCWFLGCRTGVAGKSDALDAAKTTNDVTVEHCDFSQFPSFHDVAEIVVRAAEQGVKRLPERFSQARANGLAPSNLGLVLKAGSRWKLLANYIHDSPDAITSWSTGASRELEVADNFFERIFGGAVETGNAAFDLHVHHNFLRDVFEPFTFNPKGGTPWPGPVTIHHNVVVSTPDGQKLWGALDNAHGCFEFAVSDRNWQAPHMKDTPRETVAVSGAGFAAYHNTILFPNGTVLNFAGLHDGRKLTNVKFFNNLVAARAFIPSDYRGVDLSGFEFAGNVVAPARNGESGPGKTFAGRAGSEFGKLDALGFADAARENFALTEQSPARGAAVELKELAGASKDVGAFPRGAEGHPAKVWTAGPGKGARP